jgi:hypothetical protein
MCELVVYSQVTINKAGCFKKKKTLYEITKYHMNMWSEQICKWSLPVFFLTLRILNKHSCTTWCILDFIW